MSRNDDRRGLERRGFLRTIAAGGVGAVAAGAQTKPAEPKPAAPPTPKAQPVPGGDALAPVEFPRTFAGRHLSQIAFPLGGVGTGCISLGGRGQLVDWEIFNRPDKGQAPEYGFAAISVSSGKAKRITRVLEARLAPPYRSGFGLGPRGVPGLSRLRSARFTGQFPLANIQFEDPQIPVTVSLDAFSPFVPLDPEASGYPAAVLRYRVKNPRRQRATVSIVFSVENPVGMARLDPVKQNAESRVNEYRDADGMNGVFMTNPGLASDSPAAGSFALALLDAGKGKVTYLRGWPDAKWWASPNLFWDDFRSDGELGPEPEKRRPTGSICVTREIEPGAEAEYTFVLAWHFPNRTPAWSGWDAPKGHENDVIGNHHCRRFKDAWQAAADLAKNLPELERRTRSFAQAMRESTLPASVRDAATANLSTLVSQTSFRTADGEFHGFEGCGETSGCCFGNCTHVWNYETTTQYVFPLLARSLRKHAFGYSQDDEGGMRHRQMLPDGIDRFGYAAADGQMGQIIKAYMDWRISGDTEWLRALWPKIKRGVAFSWIKGGWDADRDGVMEGVQHNTYDVEFYGPNPLSGIYYLGALRAAEEMARVLGDEEDAKEYRRLFESGRRWIDANLFNGEYYIQEVRSIPKDQIAPAIVSGMGSESTDKPEFQLGAGCLADQLIGQYLADLAALGPLLDAKNIRKALASVYRYNFRQDLMEHDSVQRVYTLNDEPAVLVCDYGKGKRPEIPFPYYAEAWTGMEYLVATLFIRAGMVEEGLLVVESARRRFDGERRNPWDEPECGHHYARAMSAWSPLVTLSGFDYHSAQRAVTARPRVAGAAFRSFWSAGSGWGTFGYDTANGRPRLTISVKEGVLRAKTVAVKGGGGVPAATLGSGAVASKTSKDANGLVIAFADEVEITPGKDLKILL